MSGVFRISFEVYRLENSNCIRELNGLACLQIRKTRMIKFSLKTNFWWKGAGLGSILLYTFFHGYAFQMSFRVNNEKNRK